MHLVYFNYSIKVVIAISLIENIFLLRVYTNFLSTRGNASV